MLVRISPVWALIIYSLLFSCSRKGSADLTRAREDLAFTCRQQKKYLETKKLMKSVNARDLLRERDSHLEKEVRSPLIRQAIADATKSPVGKKRLPLDQAATQLGLKDWRCPELDEF